MVISLDRFSLKREISSCLVSQDLVARDLVTPLPVRPQLIQSEEHLTEELQGPQKIDWNDDQIIGKWSVLTCDKEIYPGISVAKDEGYAQVKCVCPG